MTLIVTTISDLGILQASDSNLSVGSGPGGTGRKVFPLTFAPGALALAGSYAIKGERMDAWMPSAIADYASSSGPTLEGFAHYLEARLNSEATSGTTGLLLHIAGYVSDSAGAHPEMWFVRNFDRIDATTGGYIDRSDIFSVTEDFWTRDYPDDCARGHAPGAPYLRRYFNGFPDGRITYHALSQTLHSLLTSVWAKAEWDFRAPRDVSELALLMKLELDVVGTLFAVSDYPTPYIGGDAQIEAMPPPHDVVTL